MGSSLLSVFETTFEIFRKRINIEKKNHFLDFNLSWFRSNPNPNSRLSHQAKGFLGSYCHTTICHTLPH